MHRFKELKAWQKGRTLVKEIYKATHKFPKDKFLGITSQRRSTAVSIPSNIAEGCGRNSDAELSRFPDIAGRSAFGLETLVILCFDPEFFTKKEVKDFDPGMNGTREMIFGLKQSLNKPHYYYYAYYSNLLV
jgi:four helix bundle protein